MSRFFGWSEEPETVYFSLANETQPLQRPVKYAILLSSKCLYQYTQCAEVDRIQMSRLGRTTAHWDRTEKVYDRIAVHRFFFLRSLPLSCLMRRYSNMYNQLQICNHVGCAEGVPFPRSSMLKTFFLLAITEHILANKKKTSRTDTCAPWPNLIWKCSILFLFFYRQSARDSRRRRTFPEECCCGTCSSPWGSPCCTSGHSDRSSSGTTWPACCPRSCMHAQGSIYIWLHYRWRWEMIRTNTETGK